VNPLREQEKIFDTREMLIRLLAQSFGLSAAEKRIVRRVESLERLEHALGRATQAMSKEEVFAVLRGEP
jgi:hypothetical protein